MAGDWIEIENDPKHVSKEKKRARELRKSAWWKNILAKGLCHYCNEGFAASELTMDHIVPVSRGGRSVKGNIVPACKDCNSKKKYYTPVELLLKKIKEES